MRDEEVCFLFRRLTDNFRERVQRDHHLVCLPIRIAKLESRIIPRGGERGVENLFYIPDNFFKLWHFLGR